MIRPSQRIPFSQKDKKWAEDSARYFSSKMVSAIDKTHADMLYRAANGELDESDYLYVTNPRNVNSDKLKRFPTKLRNFDIISTNVMLLMGEKRRRGLDFTVTAINSNIEDLKKELESQLAEQYLTQQLMSEVINFQIQSGQEPDIELGEQLTLESIKKKVDSLQDKLAIQGQMALNYIREYTSLDSKFVENFYHWIATARCFSFKEVDGEEVNFYDVSPKEVRYLANSQTRLLKDAEAIERIVKMALTEVIDKFQGVKGFDEKVIAQLEAKLGYGNSEGFSSTGGFSGISEVDTFGRNIYNGSGWSTEEMWDRLSNRLGINKIYSDEEGITVQHVVWTSMCKRAKITIPNIFGEPEKITVDEDYIPEEGEDVEWVWKPQKWQCYIIDDIHIVGWEPIEYTENVCENPYNGRIFNQKHVNPMSVVEKGIAYQIKYNIIHYYIEKMFAKYEGKVQVIPLSLIPEQEGLGMEEFLYFADATGKMFVDDSKKNFANAVNGLKVLDVDLDQHINHLYEYLRIVKEEWDSLIGITPQRKGQMNASDGKSTTDNSVFRSSIMTEELYTQYEELEETDLNGMLELSKIAFAEGKKARYIRGAKNEEALIDIDPEVFTFGRYLVKAKNSGKNLQRLEQARQTAQALTQNKDGRYSDVLKVINADNISELLQEMENVEAEFEAKQQAQAEAQAQQQEQSDNKKLEIANINAEASNYRADKIYDATIESARIKGETQLASDMFNQPDNSLSEIASLQANSIKREETQQRLELDKQKLRAEENRTKTDAETKKYVADKHLEASKQNKSEK